MDIQIPFRLIELTQGQVAKVDAEDYERINAHSWYATWHKSTATFYAARAAMLGGGKKATVLMHREVMSAPDGVQVDHRHSLTLDNRKSQLRLATAEQNMHNRKKSRNNTSGYKGVTFNKKAGRWLAQIWMEGTSIYLGLFDTPEAAHHAYISKAVELFGEFARAA